MSIEASIRAPVSSPGPARDAHELCAGDALDFTLAENERSFLARRLGDVARETDKKPSFLAAFVQKDVVLVSLTLDTGRLES